MADPELGGTPIADPGDVTLGELYRYLMAFERRTLTAMKHSDDRLAQALTQMVRVDVYTARQKSLAKRISDLEDAERATFDYHRAILVAVVAAVAGGIGSGITLLVH